MTYPNIVYYHGGYQDKPFECTDAIAAVMGCTYTLPSTWCDLTRELEAGAEYIAFHAAYVINNGNRSIREFAEAIFTLAENMPNFTKLKIGVVINRDTDLSVIRDLKSSRVSGILLDVHDYSMEEVCAATIALISDKPYWPEYVISQLPNATKLPLSIYFREDWKTYITPVMLEKFKENAKFDVAYCSDWAELDAALDKNPHQLIFHISMLDKLHITIPEFMSMLKTRLKLVELDIPIAVGFEPTTTVNTINELKSNGVFSITPSAAHWGLEEITRAMNSLAERIPYWPEHIISQLPVGNPRYIYFREDENTHISLDLIETYKKILPVDMVHVVGWDKLDNSLTSDTKVIAFNIKSLFYNTNLTLQEIMSMIHSKLRILNLDIPVVVGINSDTPLSVIKQLKKEGVHSIIPTHEFGIDEVVKAVKSVIDGVHYWPKHIIDQLPGSPKKKKIKPGQIALTARQNQILKLIKDRGAPNKVIAKALNLSESTVKLHVGSILKKYGLKNRTQLALFTNDQIT